MNARNMKLLAVMIALFATSGCASYRVSSNINAESIPTAERTAKPVLLSEDSLPNRKYEVLGPIEISVKKLTVFHNDPTKEQANWALIEKARAIGANAVINVTYKSGIGLMTWGYIDASGTGVKLTE